MKKFSLLILASQVLVNVLAGNPSKQVFNYPVTPKINHTDTYFGTEVSDPYQWLENDTSAETTAWVDAENKVTSDYLAKIPYRDKLKQRYKELYDYAKLDNPIIAGKYILFNKKEGLQNQAITYIQYGMNGIMEEFINPNTLDPKGLTTYDIIGISNDNKYVAISVQKSGSDWQQIIIYELETKKQLADQLNWVKFSNAAWYKNGFFYSRYPKPAEGMELSAKNEFHSVYYHKLGDTQDKDELVYKDPSEPLSYNSIATDEMGNYMFLYRSLGTYGNEIYWKKTSESGWDFKPLFTGNKNEYSIIDVVFDNFIVLTDEDAPNRQLISLDPLNADKKSWKTVLPEKKNAYLAGVYFTGKKMFSKYLENASSKLYVYDDNRKAKEIALPGTGEIEVTSGRYTDTRIAYTYTSFNYPNSIFVYDISTGYSNLFAKPSLKFNPEDFVSKQVWYKSKDGTKVSMFIVHKKGLTLNGKNPTLLYGYGGFSVNMSPTFSASRILLLENGGVFAMPNLRGGAEYGEEWHKAGMLMNKQTVFNDFIAAAEYLIKMKYTSKNKLGISGGSNGGLLVGACMTQRPDLYKVAFPAVGVMDMLKFHKFTIGWGWVPEYGSADQSAEMFNYLKGYSPYHNIKPGVKYPATLITTADHDDRVVPAHSFKFAARLQEYGKKDVPLLIRIEKNAGHGKGKPTSKIIDEQGDIWSFFFWNVGVKAIK